MATDHQGADILHRETGLHGDEGAEAAAVQGPGHTHQLPPGQPGGLVEGVDHGIQGIGGENDEGIRGMPRHLAGDLADDAEIGLQQVFPAHPRPPGHPGGDDHQVRPGDGGKLAAGGEFHVITVMGAQGQQVQHLAPHLGLQRGQVDQHQVAQLLLGGDQGQDAADLPGPDQGDLVSA